MEIKTSTTKFKIKISMGSKCNNQDIGETEEYFLLL